MSGIPSWRHRVGFRLKWRDSEGLGGEAWCSGVELSGAEWGWVLATVGNGTSGATEAHLDKDEKCCAETAIASESSTRNEYYAIKSEEFYSNYPALELCYISAMSGNSVTPPTDFCVAVAAYPTGGFDVQSEVDLVKSCILYAGHIRLYSPTAALVFQIGSALKSMSRSEAVELVLEVMKYTDELPAALEGEGAGRLKQAALEPIKKGWTRKKKKYAKGQRSLRALVDGAIENFGATARRWRSTPSYRDLQLADNQGILSFAHDEVALDPMEQVADFTIAAQGGRVRPGTLERDQIYKERMLGTLLRSVEGQGEYPLLDHKVRSLVRASKDVGLIDSASGQSRSKPMGLGENIFRRLPVPNAPMDELLDLRDELENTVSRFRRGLLRASLEIRNAQWDESFDSEASEIYLRHVAPALDELEESLQSTPALRRFFQFESGIKATGIAGGLSLIINNLFNLAPEIVGSIGLVGAAATFAAEQIRSHKTHTKRAKENDWFLVYRARKNLEES
ncbi:MAG: hypothetical protein AAGF11_47560 [Myxococcota bacterium]